MQLIKLFDLKFLLAIPFLISSGSTIASAVEPLPTAVIEQHLGADQNVDYASLVQYGPWDDRNYDLVKADLSVLPEKDYFISGVPAFFKVLVRKRGIETGFPIEKYYPRETDKRFEVEFGGLLINGQLYRRGLGIYYHPDPANPPEQLLYATDPLRRAVPIIGEGPFNGTLSNNETSLAYSPVDPMKIIAGSNAGGGQRQSYSLDGGLTWAQSGAFPSSCCDPAIEWSPNGAIAYSATLGNASGGSCGSGFCTEIYQSTNFGVSWTGPVNVSTASSDKEMIHVDRFSTSPYFGRLYVTWHQSNVMQFAASATTTPTLTFSPTQSFPTEERGIGSDITTDHLGNIYYVWPTTTDGSNEIRVKVSNNGGSTFLPSVIAYQLHGDFDFAVPSMESRRVFIYAAASADTSGGPRHGRVYIALTDKHPSSPVGPGGAASANHAWIRVVYSDDQGATWNTASTPHAVADVATVDRYHPWIDVDAYGGLHLGFYDTRNSTNRTGVDWYYVTSLDGATTWIEETRVSAIVSQNISNAQEWGDYNGLSASPSNTIAMSWTDNRITPPGTTAVQSSYAGFVNNIAAGPTYNLGSSTNSINACSSTGISPITLTLNAYGGFNTPVTLSTPGINNTVFTSATFSPNPVTPTGGGATSTLSVVNSPSASGLHSIPVQASSGGATPLIKTSDIAVDFVAQSPALPVLSAPADAAINVLARPVFTWANDPLARDYELQVATDAGFSNIVFTQSVTSNTFQPAVALENNTIYFWRLRSSNACGVTAYSSVYSFTTVPAPGDCQVGEISSIAFNDDIESGINGWTSAATVNTNTWTISTARPRSPTSSWFSINHLTTSNQTLTSPSISIPVGSARASWSFWHDRNLEPSGATACWDGGRAEISVNGGAFAAIAAANLLQGAYTGNGAGTTNPLAGSPLWCGVVPYERVIVDLSPHAGSTVQLRYRLATDNSVAGTGWYIDDVQVKACIDSAFIFGNSFE